MRSLMDIYKEDMAGLTAKEARDRRRYWHYSAKVWLIFNTMTSDVAGPPPQHVEVLNGERTVISEAVSPFWPFWLNWPRSEIVKLYRATKPVRRSAND